MTKHFTAEFKLEAAKLVIDGYTYVKAAEVVNVSHSAITHWVREPGENARRASSEARTARAA
ncbi:MAG: transposase [Symbiopectobacterium sp.]|uniref:transposase n=1 Tax=Symbiopectobacterium sp. TaxID=2952789 RepID=UPI003F3C7EBE